MSETETKCPFCDTKNQENSNYCNECGGELKPLDSERLLGVKITTEDLADYVILGTVKKTIKVGTVSVGIRTLKSGEWKAVNYAAESMTASRQITFTIEQNQRVCAYGLWMINGNDKLGSMENDARYEHVQGMASDFVEIVASKVLLLHRILMAKIQEGAVENF